ncbi:aspartate-semialdehyde dehydrogenase [Chlamydia pecorum]|uniref:Aspartate-semialdehyde dehydrogenase n=1 Tax=Chlamydia pecorum (strain ATCC VR-628 / DSM 29919 / E58) TaxID=331635 RepID=A0AA34WID4_CHLPE|nr:aspartate-semialdehyde dehydrogenase [Chlamydia pecorum]AEB42008.1 aspartate-semialdehyde dehydrogenase [Chlamydia pecorum E58]AGW40013.1 aspartate-semialdehyde dehydrogenase [Chlamydia pecorum P787]UJT77344.1 aspartate-semialdehyde dehydrogenase [Chlamydia pecorum]
MRVAILGATGLVGQKFIALLQKCNNWEVGEVVASEAKYGHPYHTACVWQEPLTPLPQAIGSLVIQTVEELQADIVVSFLPEKHAEILEAYCLSKGKTVFSNASAYRMHPYVPILIPELNKEHILLIEQQPFPGRIITNSNCCVSGVALALAPLRDFGLDHIHIVTLQSASGAGYPGVPSTDLLSNTIPFIAGEEEKILRETKKILGTPTQPLCCKISVSVHRVPVVYGHMFSLHISFLQPVDLEEIAMCYEKKNLEFPGTYQLYKDPRFPQARHHLTHDDMRVHIGPITYGGDTRTIKMNVLVHNLVRGAAGAVLANMEWYVQYCGGRHAFSCI